MSEGLTTVVENAHQAIARERVGVDELVDACALVPIDVELDLAFAAEVLSEVKGRVARLEERRKRATRPLLEAKAEIDSWFRPVVQLLEGAERGLKSRMAEARGRFAAAHAEEAAAAREIAREAAAAGDLEGAVEAMALAVPARVAVAGAAFRDSWEVEVIDPASVPREWCVPDVRALREAARAAGGALAVPGVRVYRVTTVAGRAAR